MTITKNDRGEWVIPEGDVETLRACLLQIFPGGPWHTRVAAILPVPGEDLARCPWCWGKAVVISGLDTKSARCSNVDICGASGPRRRSASQAVDAWNKVAKLVHPG